MSYGMAPCLDCAPEKPCGSSLCHDGKIEVCGNCGSGKQFWEKRNHSTVYVDYDWYCTKCGFFIRPSTN